MFFFLCRTSRKLKSAVEAKFCRIYRTFRKIISAAEAIVSRLINSGSDVVFVTILQSSAVVDITLWFGFIAKIISPGNLEGTDNTVLFLVSRVLLVLASIFGLILLFHHKCQSLGPVVFGNLNLSLILINRNFGSICTDLNIYFLEFNRL